MSPLLPLLPFLGLALLAAVLLRRRSASVPLERQRQLEERLAERIAAHEADLRAARADRIRLATGISHDLNNLLVAVIGASELLVEELGPDHPSAKLAEDIARAGQQTATLLRDLLASTGRLALQFSPTDPAAIVRQAVAEHDGPVHLTDEPIEGVVADALWLHAAIRTLVRAVGPEPTVSVSSDQTSCRIVIRGASPVPHTALQPFGRPQHGLAGAAIVGIARAHLGSAEVVDGGFRLQLPLVPSFAAACVHWYGDDPVLRELGPSALRLAGFEVHVRPGAPPAGARLVRFDPQVRTLAGLADDVARLHRLYADDVFVLAT